MEQRAIELGHCFLLGDRYTKAFNAIEGSPDVTEDKKYDREHSNDHYKLRLCP